MWDRGATQWTCHTSQLGKQWREEPQGAEGCIWEGSCRHQRETKQCAVLSGTDFGWHNHHADETWLCGRWQHRRWSKGLEALLERFQSVETPIVVTLVGKLARLQLEDSEDLDSFFIRTGVAHNATRSNLRDCLQRLGPQWPANGVWKLYGKASNRQRTSHRRKKGCRTSTRAEYRDKKNKVALAVKRDFRKGPKRG